VDTGGWIRIAIFIIVLLLVALAEQFWPRRPLLVPKQPRWITNLSVVLIDNISARLFLPLLPIGAAEISTAMGFGIFNQLATPSWLKILISVVLLDLIIYLQHRASHQWPWFWRIHRMHHTDLDIDVTSGVRFHPLEILISYIIKIAAIFVIGAPLLSVIIFEVLLSSAALFNHGNFRIPPLFDLWIRLILVTPDMHRVHHSIIPQETNSNYGFSVSWWDHIFCSYRDQPRDGHIRMIIGLKEYRNPSKLRLPDLMLLPFRKPND